MSSRFIPLLLLTALTTFMWLGCDGLFPTPEDDDCFYAGDMNFISDTEVFSIALADTTSEYFGRVEHRGGVRSDGRRLLGVSPDGKDVFLRKSIHPPLRLRAGSEEPTETTLPEDGEGFQISPDAQRFAYWQYEPQSLKTSAWVADVSTGERLRFKPDSAAYAYPIRWLADGRLAVLANGGPSLEDGSFWRLYLWAVDVDRAQWELLMAPQQKPALVSPDGTIAVYEEPGLPQMIVAEQADSLRTTLGEGNVLALSSDGAWAAFAPTLESLKSGIGLLAGQTESASDPIPLYEPIPDLTKATSPRFAPTGSAFAFTADDRVYIVPDVGGATRVVFDASERGRDDGNSPYDFALAYDPLWSADGTQLYVVVEWVRRYFGCTPPAD